jgi:DNA-3-methyladenine glycosylase I
LRGDSKGDFYHILWSCAQSAIDLAFCGTIQAMIKPNEEGLSTMTKRCEWAGDDPLYVEYHDREWGVPEHDDRKLFEFLLLEGAQAGLSWITILRKRENYRLAFDGFDPELVARYEEPKLEALLADPGIVRNRLKVRSAVTNARAFLEVQQEFGSFDAFLWRFVDGVPQKNAWKNLGEVPASTPTSDALSKDLKRRGFKFVGSTILYAYMQSMGLVNDHVVDCIRYHKV